MDVWICGNAGGALEVLKYPLSALGIFLVIFAVYFFPVLAAFEDTLPHLARNTVFFAARRPLKMLLIVLLHIVPVGIVYLDTRMNPLYAFLGATCAFAGIAMASSSLLMKDFAGFLSAKEGDGKERGAPVQSQKEILREIKRLGQ
ncbi:MAG: hypothetical protein LUG62_03100 [Clostridiales bacterium]|nr:hypothetical protein [Clostridiales bacterium]